MIILLAHGFFLTCILYIDMQSVYHAAACKMSNFNEKKAIIVCRDSLISCSFNYAKF